MNAIRSLSWPAKPLDLQQSELLEQAAQIIARMGQQRGLQILPRAGDMFGILHGRGYEQDPLLRIFRLVGVHEMLTAITATVDDDAHICLEQRAQQLARRLAEHDVATASAVPRPVARAASERRSDRSLLQRDMIGLYAQSFAACQSTEPWLRALSLLTLLDRSPLWFRQIGVTARETFVRWAVESLLTIDFD